MTASNALKKELERTRALRRVSATTLRAREQAFNRNVATLSAQIRPAVANALREEGTRAVAEDWLADAEAIAAWLSLPDVHDDADESSPQEESAIRTITRNWLLLRRGTKRIWSTRSRRASTVPQRAASSNLSYKDIRSQLARTQQLTRSREALHDELAKALRAGSASELTSNEIDEHSDELAQLLLSNWFALLERALEDSGSPAPLRLSANLLPPDVAPQALVEGCEAFVLSPGESAKALLDFQKHLAPEGQRVQVLPSLELMKTAQGWQVARPGSLPMHADAEIRRPARTGPALAGLVHQMTQRLAPWVIARPLETTIQSMRMLTAARVESLIQEVVSRTMAVSHSAYATPPTAGFPGSDLVLNQILDDLDESLQSNWVANSASMPLVEAIRQASIDHTLDPAAVYRICLPATAVALRAFGHVDSPELLEHRLLQPEDELLVSSSVEVVVQAVRAADSEDLAQRWREATSSEGGFLGAVSPS